MKYKIIGYLLVFLLLFSCREEKEKTREDQTIIPEEPKDTTGSIEEVVKDTCELEKHLVAEGLVDIQKIIPGILIDLRYSDTNNFLHKDIYGDLERIYLQPDVAEKLKLAQQYLKEKDSSLTLLVFDGVRPRSIQQMMWDSVNIPLYKRGKFVSNPKKGSLHNFGAAVDITIAKNNGEELDMGTEYDDSTTLSYPEREKMHIESGKITHEQVKNRQLLRDVMTQAGFFNIQTEWWHFNSCYREEAAKKYILLE